MTLQLVKIANVEASLPQARVEGPRLFEARQRTVRLRRRGLVQDVNDMRIVDRFLHTLRLTSCEPRFQVIVCKQSLPSNSLA